MRLTDLQIEVVCRTVLLSRRRAGVRDARDALRLKHGAAGRTERVARIFKRVAADSSVADADALTLIQELRERVRLAETRAQRAEEIERGHQDYWAQRYADKLVEWEQSRSEPRARAVTSEQYLSLQRRVAELARRLARYEPIDSGPQRDE